MPNARELVLYLAFATTKAAGLDRLQAAIVGRRPYNGWARGDAASAAMRSAFFPMIVEAL